MIQKKAIFVGLTLLVLGGQVGAEPRHDMCADVGSSFAFGVSTYGSLRAWAPEAIEEHGADFRFLYVYILADGMEDPDNFEEWYVRPMAETTIEAGAVPVFTFYQLLDLGRASGYGGNEPEVVARALDDSDIMSTYFDNFVWLLEIAEEFTPPVVIHVEPDSWGFMMWAMGVEGNNDPTSVPVQIAGSGHPDLADLTNDAAGLGQALLRLRDLYGPSVRLGWHASNFRVGTRPEVVVGFFSHMGDWDVLVGEHFHFEADESTWWEPWDTERVEVNLSWLETVVDGTGLPFIFWQVPIGTSDWHLLGDIDDISILERCAQAGAVAMLFEHIAHRGESDPDDIRASGALGTTPPDDHPAGGRAADMRARVTAYSSAPLAWPMDSICAREGPIDPDGGIDASVGDDADLDTSSASDSGADASRDGGTTDSGVTDSGAESTEDDGCGCTTPGFSVHGVSGRFTTMLIP